MSTIVQALTALPWDLIAIIGREHGLGIDSNLTKVDLIAKVADRLAAPQYLSQYLAGLGQAETQCLADLVWAGGRVRLHYLTRRYGQIRENRDLIRAYRQPSDLSTLERLQVLGLSFVDKTIAVRELYVPTELLPLLSDLAPPASPADVVTMTGLPPVDLLCHDLTTLLALLQRDDISPLHGRWLPPRFLAEWGEACSVAPASPRARSERQTGRRRLLHYLAESAGWIGTNDQLAMSNEQLSGSNPSTFKTGRQSPTLRQESGQVSNLAPTPAAWLWLNSSRAERLQTLWQVWNRPNPKRWAAFHLPGADWLREPGLLLEAVHQALLELDPAEPDRFAEWLLRRRPPLQDLAPVKVFEPIETLTETIVQLLRGPLVWLGVLSIKNEQLTMNKAAWSMLQASFGDDAPTFAKFSITSDIQADPLASSLTLTLADGLPAPPDLAVAIEVSAPEQGHNRIEASGDPAGYRYHLTAVSVIRALQRGWSPPALREALERLAGRTLTGRSLTGRSLTGPERKLLRRWAEQAGRLTLRPAMLLETSDPQVITRLASTRRGKALIQRTLSPRAVVVDPARLEQLVRRLIEQEGVPPQLSMSNEQLTKGTAGSLDSGGAAHVWLALQVVQGLGRHIRLPVRTPQALLDRLAALATPADLAAAEIAAEQILAALHPLFDGRAPFPPWSDEGLPEADSLPVIEAALAKGHNLDLHYFAASTDRLTHRLVEPYRLEWQGDTPYLIGFCHHAQAERTFRVDRIRAVAVVEGELSE